MTQLLRGIITGVIILTITIVIIIWGRGYRVDFSQKEVKATGSLVATSQPNGAQVFINGEFRTATNQTLQLSPGEYQIRIQKEGYIPWEKIFTIKKEVAVQTDATLFPTNPSLSPLTSTGIENPTVSLDSSRIVFARTNNATNSARLPGQVSPEGLWVLDLAQRPLSLNRNPKQIAINTSSRNWSQAKTIWSPDSKQILAVFKNKKKPNNVSSAYLLQADQLNSRVENVTSTYEDILSAWKSAFRKNQQDKLFAFPEKIVEASKNSIKILSFAPDETKLLYQATASATLPEAISPPLLGTNPTQQIREIEPGKIYVYDAKEDRNYFISEMRKTEGNKQEEISNFEFRISNLPATPSLAWFSDSRHLILPEHDKITLMEYDGSNKTTVYAGPFEDNFVTSWPSGGKLIILTTLNPTASKLPNLYLVNLR